MGSRIPGPTSRGRLCLPHLRRAAARSLCCTSLLVVIYKYVGNLPYSITDDELSALFEPHDEVSSAKCVMDRETGRARGFGFVEMPDDNEAQAAIDALNGDAARVAATT